MIANVLEEVGSQCTSPIDDWHMLRSFTESFYILIYHCYDDVEN